MYSTMRNFTSEQATEMAETNPQAKRKRDTRHEAKISRDPSFTDEQMKKKEEKKIILLLVTAFTHGANIETARKRKQCNVLHKCTLRGIKRPASPGNR